MDDGLEGPERATRATHRNALAVIDHVNRPPPKAGLYRPPRRAEVVSAAQRPTVLSSLQSLAGRVRISKPCTQFAVPDGCPMQMGETARLDPVGMDVNEATSPAVPFESFFEREREPLYRALWLGRAAGRMPVRRPSRCRGGGLSASRPRLDPGHARTRDCVGLRRYF